MIFLALLLPLSMLAQKVPETVQKAFKKRFPTVTKVGYEKEKSGEYEANFKIGDVKTSANFTAEGVWRETESEIGAATLPAHISKAILAQYPKAKIVGAAKIETPDKGVRYEADLKTGLKKAEVLFDDAGKQVK